MIRNIQVKSEIFNFDQDYSILIIICQNIAGLDKRLSRTRTRKKVSLRTATRSVTVKNVSMFLSVSGFYILLNPNFWADFRYFIVYPRHK